jgi:hypothetical protein
MLLVMHMVLVVHAAPGSLRSCWSILVARMRTNYRHHPELTYDCFEKEKMILISSQKLHLILRSTIIVVFIGKY